MATYASMTQPAVASTLIWEKTNDSFFNPVTMAHTGYAADGFWYDAGVQNSALIASWFSEAPSIQRGGTGAFPPQALALLSTASLTIFDQSSDSLVLWMVFYFTDGLAFSTSYPGVTAGFTPTSVTWANGLLSVVSIPDPGSSAPSAQAVTFDFTQDQVFLETSA